MPAESLLPMNADVPEIDAIFVPEDDAYVNPLGAKGIGELPMVGVAAAIGNAVYNATGKRKRDPPFAWKLLSDLRHSYRRNHHWYE